MTGDAGPRDADLAAARRTLVAVLNGYQNAALLYVAARLGLADLLADGPKDSAELARSLGAHGPSLHRILRGLVALGVCSQDRDGRFGITPLGTWLEADRPGSLRGLAVLTGEEYAGAWGHLLHSAMTGETGFRHAFGMSQWEHRQLHPELDELFNTGLRQETAHAADAIVAAYDFSKFRTVADVGGGQGVLLTAILKAHPSVNGILFDQPHVVAQARSCIEAAGLAGRCAIVGGNFFDRVPDGADAHVLKSVIHDWDDDRGLDILRNCRSVLAERGRLLLVERLLPDRVEQDPGTVLVDVRMLAVTGGRERTEAEYRALLAAAGYTPTSVIPTRSPFCIIEGVRAAGE
jgi:SAM-dependent methyltransferase